MQKQQGRFASVTYHPRVSLLVSYALPNPGPKGASPPGSCIAGIQTLQRHTHTDEIGGTSQDEENDGEHDDGCGGCDDCARFVTVMEKGDWYQHVKEDFPVGNVLVKSSSDQICPSPQDYFPSKSAQGSDVEMQWE